MQVYLDNAATTPLNAEVISEITQFMNAFYGNPSSTHLKGREARVVLEKARKKIATLVGAYKKEIIFTSGGTEANNAVLKSLVLNKKIKRIISSPIEHHSILDTLEWIQANTATEILYLHVDAKGNLDFSQLEELLKTDTPTLVTLMHANNEIGNMIDLHQIGNLCKTYNALFHTDMVQTLGHYPINLNALPIDFASASSHKNHGPKGIGFIYINSKNAKLETFSHGGSQERSIRGGTENSIGIIGMAKAYEISLNSLEKDQKYILMLKSRMISGLRKIIPQLSFNGESANNSASLYNLINIKLGNKMDETFLFNLDLKGVYASEGSACSSGASKGSHVINALNPNGVLCNNLRISFSRENSIKEVDYAINVIAEVANK